MNDNEKPVFKAPTKILVQTSVQIDDKVYTKTGTVNIKAHEYYTNEAKHSEILTCTLCGSPIKINQQTGVPNCDCKENYKAEDA